MALRIEVTRDSSFCPGVDRAFRITEETLFGQRGQAYSLGPLIHNPEAVSRLAVLGLEALDIDSDDLPDLREAAVIVRSHGIDIATEKKLEGLGAVVVDATCPTVKHAQEAARELVEAGCTVVVLGSETHPEVRSIVGRCGGEVTVLQRAEDAVLWASENSDRLGRVGIVCQTTVSRDLLDSVVAVLKDRVGELVVKDTICESVIRRRAEAVELAGRVDLMLVVGGRNSSNTARLAEKCSKTGVTTRLIEDSSEIRGEWLEGIESVGVTGGASTPEWQIVETVARLRELETGRA
jgi:small subunit ribosomal protein S1/4-hydroxy-3-methylbut-2-en-1-yl diphosphate reductase